MKECQICKTANPDNVMFCSVCGTKFPVLEIEGKDFIPYDSSSDEKWNITIDFLRKTLIPKKYEYMSFVKGELMDKIRLEHIDEFNKDKNMYHHALYAKYLGIYLNQLGEDGWEVLLYDEDFNCYLLKREKRG